MRLDIISHGWCASALFPILYLPPYIYIHVCACSIHYNFYITTLYVTYTGFSPDLLFSPKIVNVCPNRPIIFIFIFQFRLLWLAYGGAYESSTMSLEVIYVVRHGVSNECLRWLILPPVSPYKPHNACYSIGRRLTSLPVPHIVVGWSFYWQIYCYYSFSYKLAHRPSSHVPWSWTSKWISSSLTTATSTDRKSVF